MAAKNFLGPDEKWPDEFVLSGGRLFNRIYPDAVFRKFPGDPPERQCFVAKRRKSVTMAEWKRMSDEEKRKFCRHLAPGEGENGRGVSHG